MLTSVLAKTHVISMPFAMILLEVTVVRAVWDTKELDNHAQVGNLSWYFCVNMFHASILGQYLVTPGNEFTPKVVDIRSRFFRPLFSTPFLGQNF